MQTASLVPHCLKLVHVQGASEEDSRTGSYFRYGSWFSTEAEAFVFPSELMARRYAMKILADFGFTYLPSPAIGREPTVPALNSHVCRKCGCTETFACPSLCRWVEPNLCSECTKPDLPVAYSIYQSPSDFPGKVVARRLVGYTPTEDVLVGDSLDEVERRIPAGLTWFPRTPEDVVSLLGTWL